MIRVSRFTAAGLVMLALPSAGLSQQRIAETVHNLSASGPGRIRAVSEQQICVFCHAPHHTSGARPLWNHEFSTASYTIYQSSTLNAQPGQPTGASKLCLSCHDGTIALGSVLSRQDHIRMMGGAFLPAGLTNLDTDLSDDHPISFQYTPGLALADGQLVVPGALPPAIRLDAGSELQCTACHDAHKNTYGSFLVMSNAYSALCTACHDMRGWSECSHWLSTKPVSGVLTGGWPYPTVAENACRSCHRPHSAGGRVRLLIFETEEDNCLDCHNGQVAQHNILSELNKITAHDPRLYVTVHDPTESANVTQPHVECADCHNGHAVAHDLAQPGYREIGATLRRVPGVTYGGVAISEARYEYEVCFRCHGDTAVQVSGRIPRDADTANLRVRFSPGAFSFHPVVVPLTHTETISLQPNIAHGTMLRCTDCHNNDQGRRAGGSGPDGPHGSNYSFLLERNYTTTDVVPESEHEYELCYKCHARASILSDQSFPAHNKHITEEQAPCTTCHDPHGIAPSRAQHGNYTHLINFDTRYVQPNNGVREFNDLGQRRGSCTLRCHGSIHDHRAYGSDVPLQATPQTARRRR
jgi:predicted CXXCH cytochrome family protein